MPEIPTSTGGYILRGWRQKLGFDKSYPGNSISSIQ
jgi:hypothetical protein